MSVNWVMLEGGSRAFVPLPNEQTLWTSPARTSIQLQSLNKFPGKEPFHLTSSSGRVHLTNQRIVYLPEPTSPQFQSFAAPLLRIHDSRVTAPFFGPNAWLALIQPMHGGGIPSQHAAIEARLTFKDGGAYDFHTKFVQIKERLRQAADVAAESGQANSTSLNGGADMSAVHLEQLPAYEEHGEPAAATMPAAAQQPPPAANVTPTTATQTSANATPTPDELPPDYDDVQREAVNEHLASHDLEQNP